jgi:hypothetical protein
MTTRNVLMSLTLGVFAGCQPPPPNGRLHMGDGIVYLQDCRTDLCFASYYDSLARVPCKKVKYVLENHCHDDDDD